MKAYEHIISKQIQWAKNRDIPLIGSKGKRGRPTYTIDLNMNLFAPLIDSARSRFNQGNGNEILGSADNPAKMQALHSSSALGVNVFQYWEGINQVPLIAAACNFCEKGNEISTNITFEEKFPIKGINRIPPNIDVVIHNSETSKIKCFAIECKFTEAYGLYKHNGINSAYLDLDSLWVGIPHLYVLAKDISPDNTVHKHLDSAQLIKHMLGLRSSCNKDEFKLLYLWYDVIGKEGTIHRDEIEEFSKIALSDGIQFSALSYQELIISLANEHRQGHTGYIKYLTERYL